MAALRARLSLTVLVLIATAGRGAAQYDAALNCGGPFRFDGRVLYFPDQAYAPPQTTFGYVGGKPHAGSVFAAVGGHGPRDLYRLGREGPASYRFDVVNGDYVVTLGFAEVPADYARAAVHGPGLRQFSVLAEGTPVVPALDIAAEAGAYYALRIRFAVEVKDGRLDVDFSRALGDPIIQNIRVLGRAPDQSPPAAPTAVIGRPGFGRNLVTWTAPPDEDFQGVHVLRAPKGSTAFSTVFTSRCSPAVFRDTSITATLEYDYALEPFDVFGNIGARTPVVTVRARGIEAPGIRNYHLTVAPAALRTLNRDPFTRAMVPATLRYRNRTFPVRLRYRGSASRNFSKKNWKVDFGRPVFGGFSEINLQGGFRDALQIREHIVNETFEAAGVLTARPRFVHLTLNGEELGLYTEIQQIDPCFLEAGGFLEEGGRDDDASIYKATGGTLHVPPNPQDYERLYRKSTNESAGYGDLIAFIRLINDTPAADFPRVIADQLDVDAYLSYQAVLIWMGSWDSVHTNYYLVHHHDVSRWEYLPWDNDSSFGNTTSFNAPLLTGLGLDYGTKSNPRGTPPNTLHNQLLTRMLDVPLFRWKYVEKLEALTTGVCAAPALDARIDAAFRAAKDVGEADLLKWGWEDSSYFLTADTTLKRYRPARVAYLAGAVPAYKPSSGPRVLINELMPDNRATRRDEAGDYDDWFELYNPGLAAVDLSGMHVTDDLTAPAKWRVPNGTTIAPGGRLLFWADDEPTEGPLHATFKLSAGGEVLALFDTDGKTLVDVLHFHRLREDLAVARRTDGHAFFATTALPTPGAPNAIGGNLPPVTACPGHTPNAPTPRETVVVTARVTDDRALQSVTLHYGLGAGFRGVTMYDDGQHGDGEAGDDVYGATIPAHGAGTAISYYIEARDGGGWVVRKPRSAPAKTLSFTVQNRGGASPVRLHEFLADNAAGIRDERAEPEDWLELRNPSAAPVDVSGYYMTDDLNDSTKWRIPNGTSIPAGGALLVWADDEPGDGPLHAAFRLGAGGEEIGLYDRDGRTLLDLVVFGAQFRDVSTGRLPDAFDVFATFPTPTPRTFNSAPASGGYLAYGGDVPAWSGPTLAGGAKPVVGGRIEYRVGGAAGSASALLATSLHAMNLPAAGFGVILVHPLGLWFTPYATNAKGDATVRLPVPAAPALAGVHVFAQTIVQRGSTPSLSAGVIARIGP